MAVGRIAFMLNNPIAWVYERRATPAAGVNSGRHWIGKSASPGRTAAKISRTGSFSVRQLSTTVVFLFTALMVPVYRALAETTPLGSIEILDLPIYLWTTVGTSLWCGLCLNWPRTKPSCHRNIQFTRQSHNRSRSMIRNAAAHVHVKRRELRVLCDERYVLLIMTAHYDGSFVVSGAGGTCGM